MKAFLTLCLILFSHTTTAQKLLVEKKGWKNYYYLDNQQLPPAAVWPYLQHHPQSQLLAQKAKHQLQSAHWIQAAATLILGVQSARWISSSSQPKWQWSLPAAAALGLSIPLERKGNKNQKKAILIYNKSITN